MYIYHQPDWPQFSWDHSKVGFLLAEVRHKQGQLSGRMEALNINLRNQATIETFTLDVLKSSEIEGELFTVPSVRSSVARHLGLDHDREPENPEVDGIVDMILDATENFNKPVTKDRLFSWHRSLFPTGYSGLVKLTVGAWRNSPMQIVSGRYGQERVHFEAPPADQVAEEMEFFLVWFNAADTVDLVLKSGIAHFWFETIHPFSDGNGRIGRALSDLLLAKSESTSCRFYSLSAQIMKEQADYYKILEDTSRGSLDITTWLEWYLGCLMRSLESSQVVLNSIFEKSQFWETHYTLSLNERQRYIINLLLDDAFFGVLSSSKWAKMNKCSQDTAHRDITDLISKGILEPGTAGGRSRNYRLITTRSKNTLDVVSGVS